MTIMSKDNSAMTKIRRARIGLLFNQPFFGSLVLSLPVRDATDDGWCPTAATDGRNIYYNRDFIDGLTPDEVMFVFCHEVMHVVYEHFGRRSHRDPEFWNMAGDYCINAMLVHEKIGKMPEKPVDVKDAEGKSTQRVGLYDQRYHNWTTEAVYDDLLKRKVKKQMTLDVHIEMGTDAASKEGRQQNGGQGIPVEISGQDLGKIKEELKNKILQAAQSAGNLPAGLKRLIGDLVEPQINWRDYLQQAIQSQLTADMAWTRPNRRHGGSDVIFPCLIKEETIDVEVSIDMSGSINEQMARDCLSEVYGITQQYNDFTLGVSTFDTKVYNRQVFNSENIDQLMDYDLQGGGGTDIACVIKWLKNHDVQPKLLIIFTDLESSDHGDPN